MSATNSTSSVRPKFEPLLAEGLIKEADLLRAQLEAQDQHLDVEQVLMRRYKISKARIGAALEKHYKCRYVAFDPRIAPPRLLLRNLKATYLRTDHWVPLEAKAGSVTVLIDDPNHLIKRDAVRALLPSAHLEYCVGLKEDIEAFIDHFFGRQTGAIGLVSVETPGSGGGSEPSVEVLIEDAREQAESGDVAAALLDEIVRDAVGRGASDIHLEPYPDDGPVDVRLRIDGRCAALRAVPPELKQALLQRIKILANLDVTERRLPQEGKLQVSGPGGVPLDLQVTTVPTIGGLEDVVLHMASGGAPLPLPMLGFSGRDLARFQRLLAARAGVVLCVGPTGGGKTTTLHAAMQHLNRPETKIWTVEDPIEIVQPGLRQVQLGPKGGLTAPAALEALLHADPDVILVGDVRDARTCDLAIEAALTGHLVLASLRTGNAAEAVGRLLDLGQDPFNVADALLGVVGQRLVRRLCETCREPYGADAAEIADLATEYGDGFDGLGAGAEMTLYRAKGCRGCQGTGYRGRIAVYEIIEISDGVRPLLLRRGTAVALREQADRDGMRTLKQDGIEKILLGLTDLREVRAACVR